jgi:hypothetical protein
MAHKIQFNGVGGLRTHINSTADNTLKCRLANTEALSLSAWEQENERSFAVGQRNVGDGIWVVGSCISKINRRGLRRC